MADVIEYDLTLEDKRDSAMKNNRNKVIPFGRLLIMLIVTGLLTAGELVLAQVCHSITLLVLVHQNIYNTFTILVAVIASKLARDRSLKNTFGWRRLEVVGSLSSLIFLFSLCFATFVEAVQTLFHSDHLDTMHNPEWILFCLAGHTAVWILAFFLIGGHTHLQNIAVRTEGKKGLMSLPNRATEDSANTNVQDFISQVRMNEILRDIQGVLFVTVTCCLLKFQILREEYTVYIDPVISIIYICFLFGSSNNLLKDSCYILLQTIPGNVEVSLLRRVLLAKFPEVLGVHEIHVWTLAPGNLVLSTHIKYKNRKAFKELSGSVEEFFREHGFKIVTIQPEFCSEENPSQQMIDQCNYMCRDENCQNKGCCNHNNNSNNETTRNL